MNNRLYCKLAAANLRRNRRLVLPYAIATAVMSGMFFIILNTVFCQSIANMSFGGTMILMLNFGLVVMAIFTFGYMLYLNSFLMKRRRREFGLYAILGLEKRHVGRMVFLENTLLNASALLAGLLGGTVFGRLIFMLLLAVMKVAPGSRFDLSPLAYLITALFFGVVFLIGGLHNQRQVRLANPIELIHGDKKGEKKLRGVLPLTVAGLLTLGLGYYCSFAVQSAGPAVALFWPAVILVIIATNLLFIAGSQFILRAIQKNKKLYYRPRVFVSVSGLIHRMKQNAAGLANICVLSCMVLVTVSCVCSLFFGQEKILDQQNPVDYSLDISYGADEAEPDMTGADAVVRQLAAPYGITVDSVRTYNVLRTTAVLRDGHLSLADFSDGDSAYTRSLCLLSQDEYNALCGDTLALGTNEALLLADQAVTDTDFTAGGMRYTLRGSRSDTPLTDCKNAARRVEIFLVLQDDAACDAFYQQHNGVDAAAFADSNNLRRCVVEIDLNGGDIETRAALADALAEPLYALARGQLGSALYSYQSIDLNRADSYGAYGGLLFMGAFFTILFFLNTVLVMYFKQVSEGFEDRARYTILRQVGMSDTEVLATINRQVLILFFAPLAVALLHIAAATNMLVRILSAFALSDSPLMYLCIAVSAVFYALIYTVAFRLTARTYYHIVQ